MIAMIAFLQKDCASGVFSRLLFVLLRARMKSYDSLVLFACLGNGEYYNHRPKLEPEVAGYFISTYMQCELGPLRLV